MKELFTTLQQEFAEYKYIKDGCPEGDARNETWESMVKSFFDGDNSAALEEFQVWCGGKLPDQPQVDVDDIKRCISLDNIDARIADVMNDEEDAKYMDDMTINDADDQS